jgi:hypothetical protein
VKSRSQWRVAGFAHGSWPCNFRLLQPLAEQQVGALLIGSDAFFWAIRDQIISLAARYAIPTMYIESKAVASGGLSCYGPNLFGEYRQLGIYTGRVRRRPSASSRPTAPALRSADADGSLGHEWRSSHGLRIGRAGALNRAGAGAGCCRYNPELGSGAEVCAR